MHFGCDLKEPQGNLGNINKSDLLVPFSQEARDIKAHLGAVSLHQNGRAIKYLTTRKAVYCSMKNRETSTHRRRFLREKQRYMRTHVRTNLEKLATLQHTFLMIFCCLKLLLIACAVVKSAAVFAYLCGSTRRRCV
jgi:hypothetical protein